MDLELLVECDDEYWLSSEGELLFQQPTGKPSKTALFTSYIRLAQIPAFVVRTKVGGCHPRLLPDRRGSS